jgi:predicted enzyme related to lactoylglutathione lyase
MEDIAMTTLNYLLLAVDDPQRSAALYSRIFDSQPVQSSPTFVLYSLPTGMRVGLWARSEMKPAAHAPGGVEVTFREDDAATVKSTYARWKTLGLAIAQEPTEMDFGFTFVAEDTDGHRLRVFSRGEAPV